MSILQSVSSTRSDHSNLIATKKKEKEKQQGYIAIIATRSAGFTIATIRILI